MKTAQSEKSHDPTRYWEKRVLYAYLRMMGASQHDAGCAVGRTRRVVASWEAERLTYAQAREEARHRWLMEIRDASRVTLLSTIKNGNGYLAMQILERTDEELSPHKQQEVESSDIQAAQAARQAAVTELHTKLQAIRARHTRAKELGVHGPVPA